MVADALQKAQAQAAEEQAARAAAQVEYEAELARVSIHQVHSYTDYLSWCL